MTLVSRELFFPSPGTGTLVYGDTFYTRARGTELLSSRSLELKSDLIDVMEYRQSPDNGRTWGLPAAVKVVETVDGGTRRTWPLPGWVDPVRDQLLVMVVDGVLPTDDALDEAMRRYSLRYRVSVDGGRTWAVDEPVLQRPGSGAPAGTPERPFAGIEVGENSVMLGDKGSMPLRTRGGRVLVPVQVCPLGPDGEYANPGGGLTYHDAAVLIGEWTDGGRIAWDISEYVRGDPERSTRGCCEPTIAELPDGRILMVIRGSNGGTRDPEFRLPGYRWYTLSSDGGATWGSVLPWTYADGGAFHSPSSMSLLLPHSNANLYWLGTICAANPHANHPRYPLVIGRVDPASGLLERDRLLEVDTRGAGESEGMTISNFSAREDRETGEIVLHASRWMLPEWIGSAYLYRIAP